MNDDLAELQRKVLALLATVHGQAARRRLCEIHERLRSTQDAPPSDGPSACELRPQRSPR
jgi:hypothetical protein